MRTTCIAPQCPKHRVRIFVGLVFLALAATMAMPSLSAQVETEVAAHRAEIPGHVVERLADQGYVDVEIVYQVRTSDQDSLLVRMAGVEAGQQATMATITAATAEVISAYETLPLVIVRVDSIEALHDLADSPLVREVGLTTIVPEVAQLEPERSASTALSGAYTQHDLAYRGANQTIAVIDSGIDSTHPDLSSSLTFEACFLRGVQFGVCADGTQRQIGPGSAEDEFGHGTSISGIIASDGLTSPLGAAPDASIESFKVLSRQGIGSFAEMLAALDYINANRPDVSVITISLQTRQRFEQACESLDGQPVVEQTRAVIQDLKRRGTITIAAAGNQGDTAGIAFPACIPEIVSVAATGNTPVRAPFSNINALTSVAAPGVAVEAAALGGGSAAVSGTSFSTPLVAACAALFAEQGFDSPDAIATRLSASPLTIQDSPFPVPWLNCYRTCAGRTPNRIVAWGQDGTSASDVIIGSDGNDLIHGYGGDDTICGGRGRDRVLAGNGNDFVRGEGGSDRLWGSLGDDELIAGGGADRVWAGPGADIVSGGSGRDRLFGDDGDDIINGNDQSDTISGGAGNDVLRGAAGRDILNGDAGDDELFGGDSRDQLDGGPGTDFGDGGRGFEGPQGNEPSSCTNLEWVRC